MGSATYSPCRHRTSTEWATPMRKPSRARVTMPTRSSGGRPYRGLRSNWRMVREYVVCTYLFQPLRRQPQPQSGHARSDAHRGVVEGGVILQREKFPMEVQNLHSILSCGRTEQEVRQAQVDARSRDHLIDQRSGNNRFEIMNNS